MRDLTKGAAAASLEILSQNGEKALVCAVLDPWQSGDGHNATLFFPGRCPSGLLRVFSTAPSQPRKLTERTVIAGGGARFAFDPAVQAGFPHEVHFGTDEAVQPLASHSWNDRLYHSQRGGWMLRYDRSAKVSVLLDTPQLTVVRAAARYCREDGTPEPDGAEAVYDWYILRNSPEVFVQAFVRQARVREWHELHHLELNVSDARFTAWLGGGSAGGALKADRKSWLTERWGALVDGGDPTMSPKAEVRSVVALIAPTVRFYDGRGEYGTYLHGAWESWNARQRMLSAWLWVGRTSDPATVLAEAAGAVSLADVAVTTTDLERRVARLRRTPSTRWLAAIAEGYRTRGNLEMAGKASAAKTYTDLAAMGVVTARSGDAGLAICRTDGGVRVHSLYDHRKDIELAAPVQPPLLHIVLRNDKDGSTAELTSGEGWGRVDCRSLSGTGVSIRLSLPGDKRFAGIEAAATAKADPGSSGWRWTLRVVNASREWGIEQVAFPRIAVMPPAEDTAVFYPTGAGIVQPIRPGTSINRDSLYPNGWCTMQYMAVYSSQANTGLYYALHDPVASSKHLTMVSEDGASVALGFDMPAPDMGRPETPFTLSGQAVWRLFRGDWYDAAQIYRAWVRRNAKWFPKLGPNGRTDTPKWMKELCAWAQTGGAPAECVETVKSMQRALGVPIGFHWYSWHEIPFDNDYPHYFPTKPGVAEAVADLQAHDVYVMPYINGRLWDTRDRGLEDYEFTSRALPAATKDRSGAPYIESYGSKESDGSPVKLAVMCPTTDLWQTTVRSIVLRLMDEVGTKAVYIDQIAAAPPVLCMDRSHGHPLGGGFWWTVNGYWPLLRAIRAAMPPDRMITSECAAESYAAMLDGFLSWEWQYDGMVPAVPAVYGGAVQYLGRNYGAGESTRDLALCMKMGQQLVYGEQIGWLDPHIALEPVAGKFLRLVVRTRHRFADYFAGGEMARPPKLRSDIPAVRADWAWYGEWWVTTPAVLTGAWKLPRERRLLLFFVNVSDKEVRTSFAWDGGVYGLPSTKLTCMKVHDPDGDTSRFLSLKVREQVPLTLPPRSLEAWEIRW